LLQKGSIERARRLLEHAIAIAPAYEPAQLLLSNMLLQTGDPLAALRTLTEFLARHPDSAGACQQITLILHRLGHRSQARRMGERAVALLRASAADHEAARMEQILAAI
jgi:Tfp pilus assembly protein PilF